MAIWSFAFFVAYPSSPRWRNSGEVLPALQCALDEALASFVPMLRTHIHECLPAFWNLLAWSTCSLRQLQEWADSIEVSFWSFSDSMVLNILWDFHIGWTLSGLMDDCARILSRFLLDDGFRPGIDVVMSQRYTTKYTAFG